MVGSPVSLWYSRAPATGAMWVKDVLSVRKRPSSRSGFTPSATRRKSLRISRSP